jgi:CRP/FNR family cyclic AMP-dependent transcriptional regulator
VQTDEQREIRRFLSAGDWFGGLPAALQELILSRSTVRKFTKGQVISLEGSQGKGLYAVLEGDVHLVRDVADQEALLHVAEPGFWFGEFALLAGQLTVVTAIAHSTVRALMLPKAQFDRIVEEDPGHYQAFAKLAFERYATLLRLFVGVPELSPEARLRQRIAAMVRQRQKDRPNAAPVSFALSQGDLARMVGVSRQTLNAILGKLQEKRLIEVSFRRILVLDPVRLAEPDAPIEVTESIVSRRVASARPEVSARRSDR